MADANSIPLASQIYEMAELFVTLRSRAEDDWCDVHGNAPAKVVDLQMLELDCKRLQRFALSVGTVAGRSAEEKLGIFAASIQKFWLDYRSKWQGEERAEKLKEAVRVDPEFHFARDLNLLRNSPLFDGTWRSVQVALNAAMDQLEDSLIACFDMGLLLGSEIQPTIAGGRRIRGARTRRRDNALVYFASYLTSRVQSLLNVLVQHFPYLTVVKFDFGSHSSLERTAEINRCRRRIGELLRNPEDAPGYLGLVLDRAGERVYRQKRSQPLRRTLLWKVLELLVKSGDAVCERDSLEEAWDETVSGNNRLDKAVSDLRKVLAPLGVCIKVSKGIGFKLIDLNNHDGEED